MYRYPSDSIEEKYSSWINSWTSQYKGVVRGRCRPVSEAMVNDFPELKLSRGFVMTRGGVEFEHWWCVTPDGDVVDPTVSQFDPYHGVLDYSEYDISVHGKEPCGRCINCGDYCYDNSYACGPACLDELTASFR